MLRSRRLAEAALEAPLVKAICGARGRLLSDLSLSLFSLFFSTDSVDVEFLGGLDCLVCEPLHPPVFVSSVIELRLRASLFTWGSDPGSIPPT